MKNLIIIDLDNTILDTVGLKAALGTYLSGDQDMSSKNIVDFFHKDKAKVEGFIEKNINNFIFDGVWEKLKELHKNNRIVLLTYGLVSFQSIKTKHLFNEYFDDIILTEKDSLKINSIKNILEGEKKYQKIFFLNDNLRQNEAVRKEFGEKIIVSDINNYSDENPKTETILGQILKQVVSDIKKIKENE